MEGGSPCVPKDAGAQSFLIIDNGSRHNLERTACAGSPRIGSAFFRLPPYPPGASLQRDAVLDGGDFTRDGKTDLSLSAAEGG
jgi:hypothetical protein